MRQKLGLEEENMEDQKWRLQYKLQEEEAKQLREINEQISSEIERKNQRISELEQRSDERAADFRKLVNGLVGEINSRDRSVRVLMDENSNLHAEYTAEIMQLQSRNLKLRSELDKRMLELEEQRGRSKQHKLLTGIELLKCEKCEAIRSTSDAQISAMRKELEEKTETLQDLESLNNVLTVQELTARKELQEARKECEKYEAIRSTSDAQISAMRKELEEKSETLQDLEGLNNVLIVQELTARKELQEARKESVNNLQDLLTPRSVLKIKRMGEIDQKAFQKACSKKFADKDWPMLAAKLCSEWQQEIGNSEWHPFKKITLSGILKEVVDDDDEKLKHLRSEIDEAAYEAVVNALVEMNDYNPSGRYVVSEIWHSKEQRRATLKEIIEYLIKQVRNQKRKRKYS